MNEFEQEVRLLTQPEDHTQENMLIAMFVKVEARPYFLRFLNMGLNINRSAFFTNRVVSIAMEYKLKYEDVFELVAKYIK